MTFGISLDSDHDLYLRRFPELRSSVGTRIKNYTAFARAIDGAGNVESVSKAGRNRNTFEVR